MTNEEQRTKMIEAIKAIIEVLPMKLLKKLYYLALDYATDL